MGKFIITEEEKRQILSKYGLLSEQKPKEYAGPTPEEIEQSVPAQRVAWRANQIQSQILGTSYEDAEKKAYNELQNLFSPEEKVYWRANELKKADPNLSDEDAEAKARTELNVPKQTTTGQEPYKGAMSLDPDAYEKFQKENPQPYKGAMSLDPDAYEKFQKENPQPSATNQGQNVNKYNYPRPYLNQNKTNQGQNVVADLNKSLATIGGEGKGVSTTTNQPTSTQQVQNTVGSALNNAISSVGSKVGAAVTTAQSAPNYNVNYKVLTPQKLTNIRTQINSTGKGNTLTPEDLQALYTTISKLPNKK